MVAPAKDVLPSGTQAAEGGFVDETAAKKEAEARRNLLCFQQLL
jgi:hypothetical protein